MVTPMKRSLPIAQNFVFGDAEAVVELAQPEIGVLLIEATLLLCAMSSTLRLRSPAGQRIDLSIGSADVRATVEHVSGLNIAFILPRNQIEYLQAVLLRAYRDEMAEVSHIHLEGLREGVPFDLTFLFEAYRPPMSPEEAATLMDD